MNLLADSQSVLSRGLDGSRRLIDSLITSLYPIDVAQTRINSLYALDTLEEPDREISGALNYILRSVQTHPHYTGIDRLAQDAVQNAQRANLEAGDSEAGVFIKLTYMGSFRGYKLEIRDCGGDNLARVRDKYQRAERILTSFDPALENVQTTQFYADHCGTGFLKFQVAAMSKEEAIKRNADPLVYAYYNQYGVPFARVSFDKWTDAETGKIGTSVSIHFPDRLDPVLDAA